jgi:hypothetical protein
MFMFVSLIHFCYIIEHHAENNPAQQTSCKLRKYDDSKSTDQRKYRSMIGSLLYVTTSKTDVMQEFG